MDSACYFKVDVRTVFNQTRGFCFFMEKTTKTRSHKIKFIGKKEIDVLQMLKAVWKRLWLVLLSALVIGGLTFVGTKLLIKPSYASSFTAYVNNYGSQKSEKNSSSVTNTDLIASQMLVKTYAQIITSRNVLCTAADSLNMKYSYGQLKGMVKTTISNETEIISVNVVTGNPYNSFRLAEAVEKYSLEYTAKIVEGSSMKIIDSPVFSKGVFSPDYLKLAIFGALGGAVISIIIICIRAFFNDTIGDEAEFAEHYSVPIVGVIPDMTAQGKGKGGYYYYYESSSDTDSNTQDGRAEEQTK